MDVLLWRDKLLPCKERIYYRSPYAIKTQLKGSKMPPWEGLLCLGVSLWHERAGVRKMIIWDQEWTSLLQVSALC